MSEYRLFEVIRTDGQKYFDIEYVRDVVTCGECKWYGNEQKKIYECCTYWAQNGGVLVPMNADDFCSYGEREGEQTLQMVGKVKVEL